MKLRDYIQQSEYESAKAYASHADYLVHQHRGRVLINKAAKIIESNNPTSEFKYQIVERKAKEIQIKRISKLYESRFKRSLSDSDKILLMTKSLRSLVNTQFMTMHFDNVQVKRAKCAIATNNRRLGL